MAPLESQKSDYADLLNSLDDMQRSPAYAVRHGVLRHAELTIARLEKELAEARSTHEQKASHVALRTDGPNHEIGVEGEARDAALTDEEIEAIAERCEASDPTDSFWKVFARAAIDAALTGAPK